MLSPRYPNAKPRKSISQFTVRSETNLDEDDLLRLLLFGLALCLPEAASSSSLLSEALSLSSEEE